MGDAASPAAAYGGVGVSRPWAMERDGHELPLKRYAARVGRQRAMA